MNSIVFGALKPYYVGPWTLRGKLYLEMPRKHCPSRADLEEEQRGQDTASKRSVLYGLGV